MSEFKLIQEVVKNSVANTWDSALNEWEFESTFTREGSTCVCSHYPISEICVIKNKLNGVDLEVGNCCVKKFMPDLDYVKSLKRIRLDCDSSMGLDLLEKAILDGVLTESDARFYRDTVSKRGKTMAANTKMLDWRRRINMKVLKRYC